MSQNKPGHVVTFYSYKGGTGRTMAVANIACLLAKKGQRALVIDWDLEAPGQHYAFEDLVKTRFQGSTDPSADFRAHEGLIDLLCLLPRFVSATQAFAVGDREDSAAAVAHKIDLTRFIVATDIAGLSVMTAGRFDDKFAGRVMDFDWDDFYDRCPSLLTALAWRLAREYDWVLIDTTAGLGHASRACTSIMPDKIVFMVSPSGLNLDGGIRELQAAGEYRRNSDDLRPLQIFPVLSRGELQGEEPHQRWTEMCRARLEECFKEIYGFSGCSLGSYLQQTEIPEVVDSPNSNEIVVLSESAPTHSTLAAGYARFVERLAGGKLPWEVS